MITINKVVIIQQTIVQKLSRRAKITYQECTYHVETDEVEIGKACTTSVFFPRSIV